MTFLTPQSILSLPFNPAPYRIAYGAEKSQFAELRLPKGEGPYPLVIVIHGGCWTTMASLDFMSPFSEALTKKGFATWNIEYRRIGEPGGGWPGTFQDVGAAIDHLKSIHQEYGLDLKNTVVVGHSSGGHLALWAAGRSNLNTTSILYKREPFIFKGAINIAGTGDLKAFKKMDRQVCGQEVISPLIGKIHYREGCPSSLVPLHTKQVLIGGQHDKAVPISLMKIYLEKAKKAGDDIELVEMEEAGHFEFIAPGTKAYEGVLQEIKNLFQ